MDISPFSGVHQFCRVGRHSLIGAYGTISKDVLPFSKTVSERETHAYGINAVGLKRHGFTPQRREKLNRAFRLLASAQLNTSQAIEKIREEAAASEDLQELIRFIESSNRGVII